MSTFENAKNSMKICWNIEVWAVRKHANLVDLVKSFPTNIYLQNLASMQNRSSPPKFAHLGEKSEKGSVSNLSTKAPTAASAASAACRACRWRLPCRWRPSIRLASTGGGCLGVPVLPANFLTVTRDVTCTRELPFKNCGRSVLGCIEADFATKLLLTAHVVCMLLHFSSSVKLTRVCTAPNSNV